MRSQMWVMAFMERTVYRAGGEASAPSGGPTTEPKSYSQAQRLATVNSGSRCQGDGKN